MGTEQLVDGTQIFWIVKTRRIKQIWRNMQMIKCNFEKQAFLEWKGEYQLLMHA